MTTDLKKNQRRRTTDIRLSNADYGHVDEDDRIHLNSPPLPDVNVRHSEHVTGEVLKAFFLRDIAISLRRLVILLDAQRGENQ